MVEPSDYGVGELCSLCGELYGPRAIYCEDGDVICEECEATGADSVQPKEGNQ